MQPTRKHLMRKSSNIENTPISARGAPVKHIQGGMCRNGLHRIRRKVSGVKPYAFIDSPEQQLKKRFAKVRAARVELPTPPATPAAPLSGATTPAPPSGTNTPAPPAVRLDFPRYLKRPEYKPVPRANLVAIEPHLAGTPLPFIRENLARLGYGMQNVLAGVQTAMPTSPDLPKEITITVHNVQGSLPTHMFAIYQRDDKAHAQTRVTLYPVHDIVLAAHCAHFPKLPPSARPAGQVAPGTQITIPLVGFPIPHPESFPMLSAYLYNKRHDVLLSQLFSLRPEYVAPSTNGAQSHHMQYAIGLARTFNVHALVRQLMVVNGLWRNVCALGIFDDNLWHVLDLAWEVILSAIAISVGRYRELSEMGPQIL